MAVDASPESSDLAGQATDWVVEKVDRLRALTTENAVLALRIVVFGLVISVLVIAALLLGIVMVVRLADAYLPIGAGVGDASWAAHGFIGVLFSVIGLGAWLSRTGSTRPLMIAGLIDVVFVTVIVCYGIFS